MKYKYLSTSVITWAINALRESTHPFLGITFLTCKQYGLAPRVEKDFPMDRFTREFMDRHQRLSSHSEFYFQPYKSAKFWVSKKYPVSGLQTVNTQTFGRVFLHKRTRKEWGFSESYLERITETLSDLGSRPAPQIPLLAIAVWLGKKKQWPRTATIDYVKKDFIEQFRILEDERRSLFFDDDPFGTWVDAMFSNEPADLEAIAYSFSPPPDESSQHYVNLADLKIRNFILPRSIGILENIAINFGKRLTLMTGDNGLGKTLILDVVWWILTGEWSERSILPFQKYKRMGSPDVRHSFRDQNSRKFIMERKYDWTKKSWSSDPRAQSISTICIYARVDGSFAVFGRTPTSFQSDRSLDVINLESREIWDGKAGLIEGIVRDWSHWQMSPSQEKFDVFKGILEHLSPEDLGILRPGNLARIPSDPRPVPTLVHPYGEVPIVYASAGIKRVLALTYLIVWAWHESTLEYDQENSLNRNVVVLLDEIDAHLHPRWQRTILPSLLQVGGILDRGMKINIQVIAATHSPMILASMEGEFRGDRDALYHLDLCNNEVVLEPMDYYNRGDVSNWLMTPVFGLKHARGQNGARAIEAAIELQLAGNVDKSKVQAVHNMLREVLSSDDPFWPRWLSFAHGQGADL